MKDMSKRKEDINDEVVLRIKTYDYSFIAPFTFDGEREKNINYKGCLSCKKCILHHKFKGLPTGNLNAKYMFVGEAPSTNRAGLNIEANYVWHDGPSSKLLKDALQSLDILKDSFFTNVIKCSLDHNQSQRPEEYEYCMNNFLLKEIELVNPKYIVLMGNQAFNAFMLMADYIHQPYEGRKMMHPSYFIYKGKKFNDVADHVREVLKLNEDDAIKK